MDNRYEIMLPLANYAKEMENRDVYVFGAGQAAELLIEYLKVLNIKVCGIFDNNSTKWENEIYGINILNPKKLPKKAFVIIASMYHKEISNQLESYGLKKNLDYADDYENWMKILTRYRFIDKPVISNITDPFVKVWYEKSKNRPIVVWGTGTFGRKVVSNLVKCRIEPEMVIDNDGNKKGTYIYNIPVKRLADIDKGSFIIVAMEDLDKNTVINKLSKYGFELEENFIFADEKEINKFSEKCVANNLSIDKENLEDSNKFHFFIHNSGHTGDVILTRPIISEIKRSFPSAYITLECSSDKAYLWRDLELPIVIYEGCDHISEEPTKNCPSDAIFLNMWFGTFGDILEQYGLTYSNNVHTFNRYMYKYHLQNVFQIYNKKHIPMVEFYKDVQLPFDIKENGILVENGDVFAKQSNFYLNDYIEEISNLFPNLNFYCAAPTIFNAKNVIDCSRFDAITLSEVGNRCIGLLTRGSGINAATETENNRYKPRCIVGWSGLYGDSFWCDDENPIVFASNFEDVKNFLLDVSKTIEIKKLTPLEKFTDNSKKCKILKTQNEVEQCSQYLQENELAYHSVTCKNWEIAYIIDDLSDGNILDMGSTDSYILKNSVLKGIKGEKFGIDFRIPDVPLAEVKYLIGDLLEVPLPDKCLDYVTCLSVLEHGVDIKKFSIEASRLLKDDGKLYITVDYWNPKVESDVDLYGLPWNIFDKKDVENLVSECASQNLCLIEDIDWNVGDTIVNPNYYSPGKVSYTFGMFVFKKKA